MSPTKKILLIDDDSAIAEMVAMMVGTFRRDKFTLVHAATFSDGLVRMLSGEYALCLLDFHLGERNGLELLREVKAQGCQTPVILLTGDSNDDTDIAAMEGGAVDFIDKAELGPRMLERAVRYALKMSAALARVSELAAHDELTKLPNRREFDRRLLEAWQRAVRFQRPLGLVSIDLDHFKQINDAHGHPVGDEVLQHVAALLAAQIRQVDCLARIGGDEFTLLLTETDLAAAQAVAARLRAIVAASPCQSVVRPVVIAVTISTGVAAWPETAETLAALIAAADAALYEAKRTRALDLRQHPARFP